MTRAQGAAAAAVVALAAVLRLVTLGRTPLDPFYDASVRSMGTSWHAFLVGAFDPSARLAIDKPPVDLWLQVAATKVLGFSAFALLLPAAVGGTLAVAALYALLRTLAGHRAALAGALCLAVLPVAVITSRSDTMDSVMAFVVVAALAVAARGLRGGRTGHVVVAGALLGLAFEIKLFEALVAAAPLALLWWLGADAPRRVRARGLAAAAGAGVATALAWLVAVTVLVAPAHRPWAFGSTDGSAWNATFVYDGWDRLAGTGATPAGAGGAQRVPAAPGALRLVSSQAHLGRRLGLELVAAWAVLLLALALRAWRRLDRAGRAGLAALAAWLALGTVLFSVQRAVRPRYLEAFDPAVAACLGAGTVLVVSELALRARRLGAAPALAGIALGALLAAPLAVSVQAVAAHTEDSGAPGALPARRLDALSAYLRAHQGGAHYETASVAVSKAGGLIARDGRPVLMLTATAGRPLVSVGELARLVAAGDVRTAIVGDACRAGAPGAGVGCSAPARWIRAHGVDVSRAAGQPRAGFLYALGASSSTKELRKRHVRMVELKGRSDASPGQP